MRLVARLSEDSPPPRGVPPWVELDTRKWSCQFVEDAQCIPPLEPW